jgi:hypothetical protein
MTHFVPRLACLFAALVVALAAAPLVADEKASQFARRREQLLAEMRALAEKSKVSYVSGRGQPQLADEPIFRYDDQPRGFIDATMWIWTDGGRPVALQKIEAKYHVDRNVPQWGYCFASVSSERIAARWAGAPDYRSRESGADFRELADAPAVALGNVQRKRQAREISRQFTGTMLMDPQNNVTQEMRLLTTPLYEYSDAETKLLRGAVFALAINGTNPDLLILLEVRGDGEAARWHFAPARMTSGGVTLRHKDQKVWEVPWVHGREAPFPTWTFFETPRAPVVGEATPESP